MPVISSHSPKICRVGNRVIIIDEFKCVWSSVLLSVSHVMTTCVGCNPPVTQCQLGFVIHEVAV